MDNHEKREIRKVIAQKNISDERLFQIIVYCARKGWIEELKLALNVSRSSVEYFDILIVLFE